MNWGGLKEAFSRSLKKCRSLLITETTLENRRHRKEAYQGLLSRYKSVFLFWWKRRDQIKMPDLTAQEADFLPGALALQAAPVSPSSRWVARTLIGLLLTFFVWSVAGKMDIVINGQGKIIAGGYTKTIASVEVAKVVGLYVQEGQSVRAGDVLIELDSRGSDSEQNKAKGDRQLALLQVERSKAMLQALNTNRAPKLLPLEGVDEDRYQNAASHLNDQWLHFVAKRMQIASQIRRFSEALALASKKARDYAELAKEHDVSTHAYLEKEQARIDLLGQLEDSRAQLVSLTADMRKTAQDDLHQATRIWSGATQDMLKAQAHSEQLRITSPIDGVIQQLSVHTLGGVVPAAQPLMLIVPSAHTIELEAYIENKDIGFIKEGQQAQVKIDAYEYTKYGTIVAVVTHISRDAIDFSGNGTGQLANKPPASQKGGAGNPKSLMYAVKVILQKPSMVVDGKEMMLIPGMSGSVEIKTGERRIIEYVLSPLITHARESLRER